MSDYVYCAQHSEELGTFDKNYANRTRLCYALYYNVSEVPDKIALVRGPLDPWSIIRIFISAWESAAKTLVAVPFAERIPRPTTAISASPSIISKWSGLTTSTSLSVSFSL